MASEGMIESMGEVTAVHRGGMMTVLLANGHEVNAKLCGKMVMNHIRCILGDQVLCELSPYDLTKARIRFRFK
jgi:translation initiation factor IF-1